MSRNKNSGCKIGGREARVSLGVCYLSRGMVRLRIAILVSSEATVENSLSTSQESFADYQNLPDTSSFRKDPFFSLGTPK